MAFELRWSTVWNIKITLLSQVCHLQNPLSFKGLKFKKKTFNGIILFLANQAQGFDSFDFELTKEAWNMYFLDFALAVLH